MARVTTSTYTSVSLASLRNEHTVLDLITYIDAIALAEERDRPA